MEKLVLENKYKIVVLYLKQHLLHQIKAQWFYTDLDLYQQCKVLQKIEKFKDFSNHLSDFPVLFKADLIFKDFSRKPSKSKYFSSMCEPCVSNKVIHLRLPFWQSSTARTRWSCLTVIIWLLIMIIIIPATSCFSWYVFRCWYYNRYHIHM